MRVICHQDFKASPWKNGGGTTYEIARSDAAENFGWRLSVADVKTSGPFSLFPIHRRILVVIEGNGMKLVSATRTIDAQPLVPVYFSGQEPIDGHLQSGVCRDFNLIFDPLHYAANVQLVTSDVLSADYFGLYVLEGSALCETQFAEVGDFIFFGSAQSGKASLSPSIDFKGLAVFIKPL